ncbi:hypothetical protein RHMOL_Rhmol08G0256400 [Rhododendron molle]|uniref:Uncharacterized protein n=1 Tax=Rhododendron molle TaxID=49168 RepID=A0ACC0MSD8_RHOML|nr:hypothetical protein RHMOL_Rhmol08G0256400 [Rhododendron molle]
MVIRVNGVYRLRYREGEKEHGSNDRENGPRVPKIGVDEVCTPHVPPLLAVLVNPLVHHIQVAVRVERHVLGEGVEELGDGLVAPDGVLDDAPGVQEANVLGAVDDGVHEEDVGSHRVPCPDVEPLERDEVQKHRLGGVVHHDEREPQHPAFEGDVLQAAALVSFEPDSRLV